MRINKKKFIYLISPNKISKNFYKNLKVVLNTGKVSFFQLRLKNHSIRKKILIGRKIKNICKKNKVKFLINDDPITTSKLDADGCHLGQKDMNIKDLNIYSIQSIKQYLYYIYVIEATLVSPRRHTYTNTVLC